MTAHWGIEDPAAVEGPGQREAFLRALNYLRNRISLFLSLPLEGLDKMTLQHRLGEIGKTRDAEPSLA
jgi:arsenate reductase